MRGNELGGWARLAIGLAAAAALQLALAACGNGMHALPTYTGESCLDAKLGPIQVHVDPAEDPPVWAASQSGGTVYLDWPSGFHIARDHGTWAVVDRTGHAVVHDGVTFTAGGGQYTRAGQQWWQVSSCSPGREVPAAFLAGAGDADP